MSNFDDLDLYNGNTEHDMWVDFDNYENAGSHGIFDDFALDNYIDNLNGWD